MTRPRLLDLFCCEGGAAVGYQRAGFDVVGVDIKRFKRYPFEQIVCDALSLPVSFLRLFDAVHASPPCQAYSVTKHFEGARKHPDLLAATRELLQAAGLPWVIENVPGAPMSGVELCGAAMNCRTVDTDGEPLVLRRHRLFESNVMLMVPPCSCREFKRAGYSTGGVYGHGPQNRNKSWRHGGYVPDRTQREELIGCDHMTNHGLAQAIPPMYTEFLGEQLIQAL